MLKWKLTSAVILILARFASAATATVPVSPTGPVLLTVEIADADPIQFDAAMLSALPQTTVETSTIWTTGVHSYTGVALADLLAALDVTTSELQAVASNDYEITIPASDAVEGGPILAYLVNGELISLRENGPIWLIYPFDSNPAYQSEVIYSRSVWQLNRLKITD